MKKMHLFGFAIALAAALFSACPSYAAQVKEPDTITIAWLPNNSGDTEKAMREEIANVISKATGKKVVNKLTTDYTIAIAALEKGDAQIGYFGPWEYLMSHAKDPKIVPLAVESGDTKSLKDALYYSRIVVKKGNEAQYKSGEKYSIDKIAGKKMSFVSTSSTSGFNMPATTIKGRFSAQPQWKSLTKEDLAQGGSGKFFSQVIFSGSHQLSLANVLMGKVDVAAVDDIDVAQYLDNPHDTPQASGAIYTVKQGADAPFNSLAGRQFVVLEAIPVLNTPIEANSAVLSPETLDKITSALCSEEVANNPKIFAPKGSKGSFFVAPHCFLKVTDSWYDPMRKVLGVK